jgi:hypothetical protein
MMRSFATRFEKHQEEVIQDIRRRLKVYEKTGRKEAFKNKV